MSPPAGTGHAAGLPMHGVRVIEMCNVAAGPYCGMLLADMGADVIKIEPPDGDMLRQWPPHTQGFSENFAALNRGKRSIALDLKQPGDAELARDLIRGADVLVENNRPGALDRLGLGPAAMRAENPALVYCSISAYGQVGPRARDGGFDVTIQAASGVMSVTGEEGAPPVKCGVPVADFAAGLYGAYAIAAALLRARASGAGAHIDVPMLGTSLAIGALQTSEYFGSGVDPRALGSAHPRNAPYQAFRARDRYFVAAAGNDRLWHSFCDVLDRGDLVRDERFATVSKRAKHQQELATLIEQVVSEENAAHWLGKLAAAGVPCSQINTYSEALADAHVAAAGWIVPLQLPSGAMTRTFGSPVRLDGACLPLRFGAPSLDGDRDAILSLLAHAIPVETTGEEIVHG